MKLYYKPYPAVKQYIPEGYIYDHRMEIATDLELDEFEVDEETHNFVSPNEIYADPSRIGLIWLFVAALLTSLIVKIVDDNALMKLHYLLVAQWTMLILFEFFRREYNQWQKEKADYFNRNILSDTIVNKLKNLHYGTNE